MPTDKPIKIELIFPNEFHGQRLDQALSKLLPEYSRTMIQNWIKLNQIMIDGKTSKAKYKIQGGEVAQIHAVIHDAVTDQAEDIPLALLHEDETFFIINKPAGLVVHPGAGNPKNTLLNALLHYDPELKKLPRAGIIHRLDKDTSGVIVVARTLQSYQYLTAAMANRDISREYRAIVNGLLTAGGTIDASVGRHPVKRTRMAVVPGGRPAVTHYRILQKFKSHTYLKLLLESGRTHQIRVHMAYIHHPIIGDKTYGGRPFLPKQAHADLKNLLQQFPRQALHAYQLRFKHPITQTALEFTAPLPEDFNHLLTLFQAD